MRPWALAFSLLSISFLSMSCGDAGDIPPARNDVVLGSASPSASVAVTLPGASSAAPRKLCAAAPAKAGEKPATVKMGHVEAPNEAALGEELPIGGGKWTWVNIWAGWCQPCLEEIPILRSWETKLSERLRVVFVSIDDDPRLAERFLKSQPQGGVRQSYHLGELERRKTWLTSLGLGDNAKLPVQILLDPSGSIRCISQGLVQPSDLPEVEALVRR